MVTAGHCLRVGLSEELDCAPFAFVFDYLYEEPGALTQLDAADVYHCSDVVYTAGQAPEGTLDASLAMVRLDRDVGAERVSLRAAPIPSVGTALHVLGFPLGLPAKIDSGARVQRAEGLSMMYAIDADSYSGSSGSLVLDDQLRWVGVLMGGGIDFRSRQGCLESRVVDPESDGSPWEQVVSAERAQLALCGRRGNRSEGCAEQARSGPAAHCSLGAHKRPLPALTAASALLLLLFLLGRRRSRL